jgi:hypothetical protein
MSYCPRPSKKVQQAYPVAGTKTVTGGAAKYEPCVDGGGASTVVNPGTPSESSTTVTYVAGPPGPQGEQGLQGWGFEWKGQFTLGVEYKAQADDQLASVVEYAGSTYIAIADNTSTDEVNPEHEPGVDTASWSLVAAMGAGGSMTPTEQSFFDTLKNDVFDWIKNATVGELLVAGAAAIGVIWAGTKIIEALLDDGSGDGDADARYNGSDGYIVAGFSSPTIKDVVSQLCEYGGIQYNADALGSDSCQITIGQNTSIRNILQQLALAYQFEMVDSGGVLKFVPRSASVSKTLTEADIGYGKGAVAPTRFTAKRFQGIDLPRSVTLNYQAEDTDYNTYTQVSQLPTYDEGQDISISVPVTLDHTKAKQIAEISLIQSHIERMQYKFTVSLNSLELEPGDVISTPMGTLRITKINELDEGLIEVEATDAGVAEAVNGSNLIVSIPPASTNVPIEIGYSQGFWIDPTALGVDDTGTRIYVAAHGYDRVGWPGAAIYMSENGGASYAQIGSTANEATIGLVTAVTPSADYHVWDETTSISVQLKTNSLLSVSSIDVLNGVNFAQIGQEVIGFRTATLTGPKTYTLSGLLRGRRGTEQFVGTHVANELFVLLDSSILKIDLVAADRNTTKKFKVVTIGSSLDKVAAEDVQIVSNNLRLWTVHNAKVLKVGTDFQFSFGERVRYLGGLRDNAEIIHDADWAGFGIVILASDGTTVVNSYVSQSETFTYTAAMQTTDFGVIQGSVKTKIVQLSQYGVPGYPVSINS